MKYKLIIFDWDGTLMDSIDKIVLCMQQAAKQENHLVPDEAAVKNIIGLSLLKAMKVLFPTLSLSKQQSLMEAYRHQYTLHQHIKTSFYKGIGDMLFSLKQKGYLLAVATGKGRDGLNAMMQLTETTHLFDATICADEANSKPDPLMITSILNALEVNAKHAVMIGDSTYDLAMANNAGVDSIGVSYGVHDVMALTQFEPIAVLNDLPSHLHHYI